MNLKVNFREENIIHIKSGIPINVYASVKNITYVKKNSAICSCENGKYLASIIDDDSVVTCDGVVEEKKTVPTNFNKKKTKTCKTQNLYILRAFLLITTALLTAVSIYCYLIKYWAK